MGRIHCNEVNDSEFLKALKEIDSENLLGAGGSGRVYPIAAEVGNCEAVVKIIYSTDLAKTDIEKEVKNLKTVKQFIGWGRMTKSDGEELDYIIMPNMGVPLSMAKGLTSGSVKKLNAAAVERYQHMYHLTQQ